ncbi:M15 family metallopeptidase [Streptomyces sp. NPDC052114]|uniref:M15 family metallopeptidase n=1 Tax=unclassified Streptomyces TaxID=2593676 RepID=UPI0034312F87
MQNGHRVVIGVLTLLLIGTSGAPGASAGERVGQGAPHAPAPPGMAAVVTAVPRAKLGVTYRPGCPVPPARLRLIRMNHWGFDGRPHQGELIVHEKAVRPLLYVFGRAFDARFPIRRMRVTAEYGGSDLKSMAADNTSAFNCRSVTGGTGNLSRHSYGDAIDINPVENPYVDQAGRVHPAAGRPYLRRDRGAKGMIRRGDVITTAMRRVGWPWGARWVHPDYQHFSANGR